VKIDGTKSKFPRRDHRTAAFAKNGRAWKIRASAITSAFRCRPTACRPHVVCVEVSQGRPSRLHPVRCPGGGAMEIRPIFDEWLRRRATVSYGILCQPSARLPICIRGGECDLQDQAMALWPRRRRFEEHSPAVKDKHMDRWSSDDS